MACIGERHDHSPFNHALASLGSCRCLAICLPAKPLMDIIPLDDEFLITTKVRPTDLDYVKVGHAWRGFSSFWSRKTPVVFGQVTVV